MRRFVYGALASLVLLLGMNGVALAATTVKPSVTPGAADPAATKDVVCAAGYAPASAVSSATKRLVFTEYHIKKSQRSKYVIDHLVPLSLGGTNDPTNLWPQLRSQASDKKGDERAAQGLLCHGDIELADAQSAFQKNWKSAPATLQVAAQDHAAKVAAYLKALDDNRKAQEVAGAVLAAQQAAAAAAAQQQAAAEAAAQQQAQRQQAACPNGTYVNSAGNTVCSPYASPSGPPAGATAQCRDGTYSFSQSRSGTCSSHGGVAQWL